MPSRNRKSTKKPSLTKVSKKSPAAITKCKNPPLKSGVISSYGELLKTKGDGTSDRDHIPSYKALEKRALNLNKGKPLTSAQKNRIKKAGKAIVLPKAQHKRGRTYGGKNTAKQSSNDASDLEVAAKKDIQAYENDGLSGEVLTNMKKLPMSNAEYDKMLLDNL